jgi:flavin reductase (DIM6/NTAB) family NADH-FMN oxidoreductase RutF
MTAFDDVVAALDPPMVVVTVAGPGGEVDGCLVGFHSQSSIDPPRYTVWLSKANRTYRLALGATHLAVHRLTADQHALAEHFGGETGDETDKLAGVGWKPGPGGVPLLGEITHRFVGEITLQVDTEGDHVAFVVEPVDTSGGDDREPSLRLRQATDIDPGHEA